jgi:hypothetical protein
MKPPTEAQEAELLVAYMRIKGYTFHHSPNETGSSPEARRRAIRVKREGTSPGFPDYVVIVNNRMIAIELKRTKGSKTSEEQKGWIEKLNAAGIPSKICKGYDEAVAFIELYADLKKERNYE